MTWTFKLDLHILPLDLHDENQVRLSVRSAMRVVTHTLTHTLTMSKLLHPSLTRGVIIAVHLTENIISGIINLSKGAVHSRESTGEGDMFFTHN